VVGLDSGVLGGLYLAAGGLHAVAEPGVEQHVVEDTPERDQPEDLQRDAGERLLGGVDQWNGVVDRGDREQPDVGERKEDRERELERSTHRDEFDGGPFRRERLGYAPEQREVAAPEQGQCADGNNKRRKSELRH
jgi:hypothetical protein